MSSFQTPTRPKESWLRDDDSTILDDFRGLNLMDSILFPDSAKPAEQALSRSPPWVAQPQGLPAHTELAPLRGLFSQPVSVPAPVGTNTQLVLLQSQLDTRDEELEVARSSEVRIRSENLQSKQRIDALEAQIMVLEARLKASARREAAALGHPFPSPPPSPPKLVVIVPEVVFEQNPELVRKLDTMELLLGEVQEARKVAELARTAAEKKSADLETRCVRLCVNICVCCCYSNCVSQARVRQSSKRQDAKPSCSAVEGIGR
jgi:hypothetical protein